MARRNREEVVVGSKSEALAAMEALLKCEKQLSACTDPTQMQILSAEVQTCKARYMELSHWLA